MIQRCIFCYEKAVEKVDLILLTVMVSIFTQKIVGKSFILPSTQLNVLKFKEPSFGGRGCSSDGNDPSSGERLFVLEEGCTAARIIRIQSNKFTSS